MREAVERIVGVLLFALLVLSMIAMALAYAILPFILIYILFDAAEVL